MTIKQNGGVFGRNPTFNNVTIDGDLTVEGAVVHDGDLTVDNINLSGNTISTTNTNGDLLLDPNGTGKVGVNELSPDRTFSVTADAVIPVRFESTGRDNQLEFANSVGTPKIGSFDDNFLILTGGSETVRVDSSGHLIVPAGITLGTTTGVHTTANTLDDYEEGTWTPAFSGGDYTFTYNKQKGSYTKIGNRVFIDCVLYVHPTTAPSGTVDGNLAVTGLPYAHDIQNDVEVVGGIAHFKQLFMSGIETLAARLATGNAFVFYDTLATNYPELAYVQASDVAANTRIRIQFSYPTNG